MLAAALLYLLVSGFVSMQYVTWSKRRRAGIEVPSSTPQQ